MVLADEMDGVPQKLKRLIFMPSYHHLITIKSLVFLEQLVITCILDKKIFITRNLRRHLVKF